MYDPNKGLSVRGSGKHSSGGPGLVPGSLPFLIRRAGQAATGQASSRTLRPSTASRYSSTSRWITAEVFSTELS